MSRYAMSDGTVIDTSMAKQVWKEDQYHDGRNWISKATGSQWDHQKLYRSRKGRFYVETTSQWQGRADRVEWVSDREAVAWLLANDHEVPEDLEAVEEDVVE